jgi:acyl-CoA thioester hydrolase
MFTWPVRIYWEDTDAGGIVFYANYLKFMERARTEWLRSLGIEQQRLRAQTGGMFIVTDTAVRYLQPARLDDQLLVSCQVQELGRASIKISQKISHSPGNNLTSLLQNQEHSLSQSPSLSTSAPAPQPHEYGIDKPVCEGTICIAWVDAGTLKPGRIPKELLEKLT